jgi:mannose-1-phosphate guanylyltransferase
LSQKNTEKTNTEYIDIIESTPRNTAAAIAFATDDILIVTPSDHIIDDRKPMKQQSKLLKKHPGIHCNFGIVATEAGNRIWLHRAQR